MRTLSITAAVILLLAANASAEDWITIGSWNFEHLRREESRQHPKALAEDQITIRGF